MMKFHEQTSEGWHCWGKQFPWLSARPIFISSSCCTMGAGAKQWVNTTRCATSRFSATSGPPSLYMFKYNEEWHDYSCCFSTCRWRDTEWEDAEIRGFECREGEERKTWKRQILYHIDPLTYILQHNPPEIDCFCSEMSTLCVEFPMLVQGKECLNQEWMNMFTAWCKIWFWSLKRSFLKCSKHSFSPEYDFCLSLRQLAVSICHSFFSKIF